MRSLILVLICVVMTYGRVPGNENVKLEGGKIVGGKPIDIEKVPYQLSLRMLNRHICGASLLQANIALTAAHCTNTFPSIALQVYGGSTSVTNDGKVSQVLTVCQHPKYNASSIDYDVSVLLFTPKFVLSPKIQNITMESNPEKLQPGNKVLVSGWGNLRPEGPDYPDTLQAVEVPVISKEKCRTQYAEQNNITERMLCLSYEEGGKDACQGDSGGPAAFENKQVGIVSWGKGCADPKYSGVYTDVTNKEIYDHIQSCVKFFNNFTFLP